MLKQIIIEYIGWNKRYKETKKTVGKGQYAQARAKLDGLAKDFHADPRNK